VTLSAIVQALFDFQTALGGEAVAAVRVTSNHGAIMRSPAVQVRVRLLDAYRTAAPNLHEQVVDASAERRHRGAGSTGSR
jgi:hypothetical protein